MFRHSLFSLFFCFCRYSEPAAGAFVFQYDFDFGRSKLFRNSGSFTSGKRVEKLGGRGSLVHVCVGSEKSEAKLESWGGVEAQYIFV